MVDLELVLLGENILRRRNEKHLSQAEVSRRSGVHATEVSRIERGLRDPRLSTLARLADALEIKLSQLVADEEPVHASQPDVPSSEAGALLSSQPINGKELAMDQAHGRVCAGSLEESTEQRTRMNEAEVLRRLLACRDRESPTRAALERMIGGDPLDLSDALRNLNAAGVIHLSEDGVSVTRTASWTANVLSTR